MGQHFYYHMRELEQAKVIGKPVFMVVPQISCRLQSIELTGTTTVAHVDNEIFPRHLLLFRKIICNDLIIFQAKLYDY